MSEYVANTQIKVSTRKEEAGEQYIQPGEAVSEGDFDDKDWNDLLQAKAVVSPEVYAILNPSTNEGANQAYGTPSNLAQIEGTELQMNPPDNDPEDEAPPLRDPLPNPSDVVPVEGAPSPGDGSDSAGQDAEVEDDDTVVE